MSLFKGFYKQSQNLLSNRFTVLLLIGLPFLFRQNIYYSLVHYQIGRERVTDTQLDALFERYILTHPDVYDRQFDDVDKIVHVALKLTSDGLSFNSEESLKTDPLSTLRLGETNSIGFASFFNTVCTYLLNRYHLSDRYLCRQYIAERMRGDRNLQDVFQSPYGGSSPFSKNRDIVAIVDKQSGTYRFVDPTLYEQSNIVDINVVGAYSVASVRSGSTNISRIRKAFSNRP